MPLPTNNTAKEALIIIGAGMAGTRFAMLLAEKTDKYQITLINSEAYSGYNRIMLSPVLAGTKAFKDIALYSDEAYQASNITLKKSCQVTAIDSCKKELTIEHLTTQEYKTLKYDKLVFATGSNPFILPLPNQQATGVLAFRTKDDVDKILALTKRKAQTAPQHNDKQQPACVVIGGGLLGLEAASALAGQGLNVSVVHAAGYVLNRQLDAKASQLLQVELEKKGVHFLLEKQSEKILVDDKGNVSGLLFKDGTQVNTSCIIMAVGVRPNIQLAQDNGINCEKGILVDAHMQTSAHDIYAIGECIQFESNLFGLVAPVYEQAEILVKTLVGEKQAFQVKATATKLKVSGVDLFSAGDIHYPLSNAENTESAAKEISQSIVYQDPAKRIYKKLIISNDKLIGVILYGDIADGAWFFKLIQEKICVNKVRQDLLFGQAFCADKLA